MPNTFAQFMIYFWPVVVVVLFQRLTVPKAIVVSIVAGYLLLPTRVGLNLPLLPTWNRDMAATLPPLIMAVLMARATAMAGAPAHVLPGWLPRHGLLKACVLLLVIGPFFTVLTNSDRQVYELVVQPGLSFRDAGSSILGAVSALIPFFLARKYMSRTEDQVMLLGALCVAGLAYSLPALWEVRMSPQLNKDIYGFFPHDWRQHLRAGGYRPVVFLEHGLRLGIFLAIALLATIGYRRLTSGGQRGMLLLAAVWLLGTLVLSKNLGALLIVCVLAPVMLFLGSRMQLLAAAALAATILIFPMMRAADLVPTTSLVNAVGSFADQSRVGSLLHRFNNEDLLLERARERPLFGWGGWGRSRVKDERGRDLVTVDGGWIIAFGEQGWTGYLGRFGLLCLPVLLIAARRSADQPLATSTVAVVLTANLIDLIPNTGLSPVTWLMAGALVGHLDSQRQKVPDAAAADGAAATAAEPPAPATAPSYRRALGGSAGRKPSGASERPRTAAGPSYRRDLTPRPRRS